MDILDPLVTGSTTPLVPSQVSPTLFSQVQLSTSASASKPSLTSQIQPIVSTEALCIAYKPLSAALVSPMDCTEDKLLHFCVKHRHTVCGS